LYLTWYTDQEKIGVINIKGCNSQVDRTTYKLTRQSQQQATATEQKIIITISSIKFIRFKKKWNIVHHQEFSKDDFIFAKINPPKCCKIFYDDHNT